MCLGSCRILSFHHIVRSIHSLNGDYIADDGGDYYGVYLGTRSLDYLNTGIVVR